MSDLAVRPGERVLVTGGAGRTGRRAIAQLIAAGFVVSSVDLAPWPDAPCPHTAADLRSLSECFEVVAGHQGVVHLAGVFAPGVETPAATFLSNVESTFNVFRAAALTGVRRVAWASTCAVTGAPFGDPHEPSRVPLVEDDRTNCSTTYALSKLAGEIISAESRLWDDVSFAALRFGRIYHPGQYGALESLWDDPHASKFNLWTYVDVRDVAQACVKAMSASFSGSEVFFITAADTVMQRDSRDLVRDVFPNAEIDDGLKGRGTLFSIEKARRLLGYEPAYSWRDELEGERAA